MTITVTWPMVVYITGIILSWSGFLIGLIRWSLKRNLATFEEKLANTAAETAQAKKDLAEHKDDVVKQIRAVEIIARNTPTCVNHQRMESNDDRLFGRLDSLHGDIRELCGGVKGLTKSLEVVNQHLLNGGK